MSNNNNLSSPDKSVKGDGNSYLDHSTNNTDARDMSTHNSVVNNSNTSSNVDNSHHIHLNVQGGDLAALGLAPKAVKEIKEMTDADRERLDRAIDKILRNYENIQESFLPKLKALATEFPDNDKAQYYYHMLLASGSAQNYITHYKNVEEKTYWLSFWAYTAFKRLGRSNEAETVLSQLSKWQEQYTDNSRVIEAYGLVYDCLKRNGGSFLLQDAADVINSIVRCSSYLHPLLKLTAKTITNGRLLQTGNSEEDFYLNIFDYDSSRICVRPNAVASTQRPLERPYVPVITDPAANTPQTPRNVSTTPKPVNNRVQVQPSQTSSSTGNSNSGGGEDGSKVKKYIIGAAALAVLFFGYRAVFSSEESPTEAIEVENVESVEATETAETPTTVKRNKAVKKERSSSETSSREEVRRDAYEGNEEKTQNAEESSTTQYAEEKPSNTPVSVPEPQRAPEPSYSTADLIDAGKRNVKSFNYGSAVKLFTEAANRGSSEAVFQLGLLYNNSNYEGHNTDRAISYMKKAAQSGNLEAMYQLGMLYTGRDNDAAKRWLRTAAANGHSKARSALERITN